MGPTEVTWVKVATPKKRLGSQWRHGAEGEKVALSEDVGWKAAEKDGLPNEDSQWTWPCLGVYPNFKDAQVGL